MVLKTTSSASASFVEDFDKEELSEKLSEMEREIESEKSETPGCIWSEDSCGSDAFSNSYKLF